MNAYREFAVVGALAQSQPGEQPCRQHEISPDKSQRQTSRILGSLGAEGGRGNERLSIQAGEVRR